MIVVLAGGMGAARFLRGLVRVVEPAGVTIVGNTGDDIRIYGVHVSPDLDIVTFALAGVLDEARQFGIAGDTHVVMEMLHAQGEDTWFDLGDRDFGICLARTVRLDRGVPLHRAVARTVRRFSLPVTLLPMTDEPVHTEIDTTDGPMHFQEYWVRRRAEPLAVGVRLVGVERARPATGVLKAIEAADTVVIAPSNPVVSVGPILQVAGIRDALRRTRAPVVGISPIIGGRVVRGMADRLLPAVGAEVSARGVAALYADILDGFVIDTVDAATAEDVERLGIKVAVTHTLMHAPEDAAGLAKAALALAHEVGG
jgi:LPPG:FO 2-phospho-L-lactate transferase